MFSIQYVPFPYGNTNVRIMGENIIIDRQRGRVIEEPLLLLLHRLFRSYRGFALSRPMSSEAIIECKVELLADRLAG